MRTLALSTPFLLWGSTSVEAAPMRPSVSMPSWSSRSVASPEVQEVSRLWERVEQQWRETEMLASATASEDDFIFDLVDPESLALAPAIAEYDTTYVLEWDNEPYPTLDVDDVDLEIITLHSLDA